MLRFPALTVSRENGRKNRLIAIFTDESGRRRKKYYGVEGDPEAVARYEYDRRLWEANHRAPLPAPAPKPVPVVQQLLPPGTPTC